jgi:hypothetical protein
LFTPDDLGQLCFYQQTDYQGLSQCYAVEADGKVQVDTLLALKNYGGSVQLPENFWLNLHANTNLNEASQKKSSGTHTFRDYRPMPY